MEQRYDVVLYNEPVTIDGRQIDGAVFVHPHCVNWKTYAVLYQYASDSVIELKKYYASLSDTIYHIVRSSKDPSRILFLDSSVSQGSFKDFLSKIKNVCCVYDDDQFVGIFMQRSMFDV